MTSPAAWTSSRTTAGVKRALFLAVALATGACASSVALHKAQEADRERNYDLAVVQYTAALKQHPNDTNIRVSLERAKLRASEDHFEKGRRLSAVGKLEDAVIELQLATELNPANSAADDLLKETRGQLRAKIAIARDGKTELQSVVERTRDMPPIGLTLPTDVKMPTSLVFRDASSRVVFLAIARYGGISIAFDPTFREAPVTIDLRNASLDTALGSVADATRTFFKVTAQNTVLVVPDTPAKRREYEEEVVRTFYLSNIDLKEAQDMMRLVLDARRISPITATNAIVIKDTPERVAAAARLIAAIDKARPEVIIDVELLEVDRTRLQEYGLQFASPGSPGLDGSIGPPSNSMSLRALGNLTPGDLIASNLPSLYYRLLRSDGNTRALANPQLRTSEGMTAQARFGEQIPIPVTTFTPIAAGGVSQQPITSFNYQNIGVNIDITPRTHHNDDVSLALKIAVQSVTGTGFGGLPTIANREINNTITLHDGETSMLAGLIRDEERRVMDGIPGIADLPVLGKIFTHSHTETTQSDVILTLTPHIIRVLDVDENDLRAFRVGRDSLAPISELPTLVNNPPPVVPQQEVPGGTPGIAVPIQPPVQQPPAPAPPSAPPATPPPPQQPPR